MSSLELISVEEAESLVSIKGPTIRAWVRQGLVAGVPGKPFRVHRESLIKYVINERGNTALQKLYSDLLVSNSGHYSEKGE